MKRTMPDSGTVEFQCGSLSLALVTAADWLIDHREEHPQVNAMTVRYENCIPVDDGKGISFVAGDSAVLTLYYDTWDTR
jgi:hypothetical protein